MSEPGEELLLHEPKSKEENIAALVRKMITIIGEDPNREGLRKTPERFEKALKFLTSGYHQNVDHHSERRHLQRGLRPDGDREGH